MELIASPCSWSWVNVLTSITWCPVCCLDMFHKDLCPPPSCQPLEKWCTSQKKLKDKLFWICLATHPRMSGTLPLQTTPHPRARRAALVPVVDRGVVTSLIELCINDILENQKPLFPGYFKLRLLLAVVFGSYWNFRPWRNSQPQGLVMGLYHEQTGTQYNVCVIIENCWRK